MTRVARRQQRVNAIVDTSFVYLRYRDGNIVDPRRCPVGNMAPRHWTRVPGDVVAGEPNMVCACSSAAVAVSRPEPCSSGPVSVVLASDTGSSPTTELVAAES